MIRFMNEIDLIEEQIEDLQIKLEIGKAEEKIYDISQKVCEEYATKRNQQVEFDYNDLKIFLTIDNTDHNFEFTAEEVDNLKNKDFTEKTIEPYDFLEEWHCVTPRDVLEMNESEIAELIKSEIDFFFENGF